MPSLNGCSAMPDSGTSTKFCVDTSAWLDGWVRYYPPDVFPSLWNTLEECIKKSLICSAEDVYREMEKKDDEVYAWIKDHKKSLLVPLSDEIQDNVISILQKHPKLVNDSKKRSTADPFVIATAYCSKCVVVTGEKRTNNIDKPRIPDVCDWLGIKSITFLEMVRALGARF